MAHEPFIATGQRAGDPGMLVLVLAPALFVVLWSTGFIAAKFGLPYAPPLTFLLYRFVLVAALMAVVCVITRAQWPTQRGGASKRTPSSETPSRPRGPKAAGRRR